jgi:hypothetical protein
MRKQLDFHHCSADVKAPIPGDGKGLPGKVAWITCDGTPKWDSHGGLTTITLCDSCKNALVKHQPGSAMFMLVKDVRSLASRLSLAYLDKWAQSEGITLQIKGRGNETVLVATDSEGKKTYSAECLSDCIAKMFVDRECFSAEWRAA